MLAHFDSSRFVDGAGMSFLLGNADIREQFDNGLGLDLEFAGQIVNANLIGMLSHTQRI
jgi:hypothetical protein